MQKYYINATKTEAVESAWTYSEPIDPDVLKAAVFGEHIDTKA